jgi:purine nucleoside permease
VLLGLGLAAGAVAAPAPRPVRVMIVSLFDVESAPWTRALGPMEDIPVPGLPGDKPSIRCRADGVCQMTAGMGHANAATSLAALIFGGRLDLRQTYFVIAGIAGIDPGHGTIGSVAWARYAVDVGLVHEVDAREAPAEWSDGHVGLLATKPSDAPGIRYGTEVFQLDGALVRHALDLSRSVMLADDEGVRAYRLHYGESVARSSPTVLQCDTASSDTWWAGARSGEFAARWTKRLTDGAGDYCTSQQEDNALLAAFTRGARAGLVDGRRILILRAGSDFDRPPPEESAFQSLRNQLAIPGGFRIASENLIRAAMPLVREVSAHWPAWKDGIPATPTR